jgi:hypothetical protein
VVACGDVEQGQGKENSNGDECEDVCHKGSELDGTGLVAGDDEAAVFSSRREDGDVFGKPIATMDGRSIES